MWRADKPNPRHDAANEADKHVKSIRFYCIAAALVLSTTASASAPAPWPSNGFMRGVTLSSWDGSYSHPDAWRSHLETFRAMGVEWIQVMTFARQPAVGAPEIRTESAAKWPVDFVREARAAGFAVFLKPHVWSEQFYDGSKRWRGSIDMLDAKTWDAWFRAYSAFILREAKLAAEHGVEMFSVGLEYVEATRPVHTARWRALIAEVRKVYPGLITYAADGNHEIGHIAFWDALDVIGINAYFAIAAAPTPTLDELIAGWQGPVRKLRALSGRYGKPIVFTEIGFASVAGAAQRPWQWPAGSEVVDVGLQARAYESAFAACTAEAWCRGFFWWKWYEVPERHLSHAHDYSPRGKPAEAVLRRWYRAPKR